MQLVTVLAAKSIIALRVTADDLKQSCKVHSSKFGRCDNAPPVVLLLSGCADIEHVFGTQETAPGGRILRTIGIVRARLKIGLQNLVYNIRRLATLERMAAA